MVSAWFERAESFSSMPWASFYSRKGLPQWHTGGGKAYSALSLSLVLQDKTHLMRSLGVLLLYRGRERGPSRPSPLLLASTCARASDACGAMLPGRQLRWRGGGASTKGCMLPRRCLPSWLGRQLHANGGGDLDGVGLAVALLARLARVLSGDPARVLPWRAGFPGKDLAGGLVGFFGEDSCLLILI